MPATPVIVYDVYKNNGSGGPVDYTTVVATVTSGTTYTPTALATPSDNTFAVRARDTANSVGEVNVDALCRIVIDSGGNDITSRPNAPIGLTARATASGGLTVEWAYNPLGQTSAPTAFHVYFGTGTPSYGSPAATVAAATQGRAIRYYSTNLTGLTDGTTYWVAVRAVNGSIEEPNTTTVSVVGSVNPPSNVENLAATLSN